MILITGGAGFIGSALIAELNAIGRSDILLVDSLGTSEKWKNIANKQIEDYCHKNDFLRILDSGLTNKSIECIFHLGACSSTTETDIDYLMENNFRFSKLLAQFAFANKIPFIYASSAATYGDGSLGFSDDISLINSFIPLNGYALSKHLFDKWIISQKHSSPVCGLKFFNVFGPNEYHKGSMRSVIHKAYHQVKETGEITLFKSEHPDYANGDQKRDFIYVKDVVKCILECKEKGISGIYNLGSGQAQTWNELAHGVFSALNTKPKISYIPLPEHLRGKYQYYTCAEMQKLTSTGVSHTCLSLKDAIQDYIHNHLEMDNQYL